MTDKAPTTEPRLRIAQLAAVLHEAEQGWRAHLAVDSRPPIEGHDTYVARWLIEAEAAHPEPVGLRAELQRALYHLKNNDHISAQRVIEGALVYGGQSEPSEPGSLDVGSLDALRVIVRRWENGLGGDAAMGYVRAALFTGGVTR